MKTLMHKLSSSRIRLIGLSLLILFSLSCGGPTGSIQKNQNNSRLLGTWVLNARLAGEMERPAEERQIMFTFLGNDLFTARFRADGAQNWTGAGRGSFSYQPPYLYLYWDSGATATLLVTEVGPESIRIHHGRNLVPMLGQDPDEIFVRQKTDTDAGSRQS